MNFTKILSASLSLVVLSSSVLPSFVFADPISTESSHTTATRAPGEIPSTESKAIPQDGLSAHMSGQALSAPTAVQPPIVDAVAITSVGEARSTLKEFMQLLADRKITRFKQAEIEALKPEIATGDTLKISYILVQQSGKVAIAVSGEQITPNGKIPFSNILYKSTPTSKGVKISTAQIFAAKSGFTHDDYLYVEPDRLTGRAYNDNGSTRNYARQSVFLNGSTRAPSNTSFAFVEEPDNFSNRDLYLIDLRNPTKKYLIGGGSHSRYASGIKDVSPDGKLVVVSRHDTGPIAGSLDQILIYCTEDLIAGNRTPAFSMTQAEAQSITFEKREVVVKALVRGESKNEIKIFRILLEKVDEINRLYQTYLKRDAGPTILNLLNYTLDQIRDAIRLSPEYLIEQLYRDALNREASPSEVQSWLKALQVHGRDAVVMGILKSPEAKSKGTYVPKSVETYLTARDMYVNVLGRNPDRSGLFGWMRNLDNGMSPAVVRTHFVNSTEYRKSIDSIIVLSYRKIIGKDPSPSELMAWRENLWSGMTRETLRQALLNTIS